MKKFLRVFLILADKRFLASLFALIAVTTPMASHWLQVNSPVLSASISGVATALATIIALFIDKPKGGKK